MTHAWSTGAVRILALGDSYTIGEGVDPADRWPVRLAERLRQTGIETATPVIIGQTGWTTDELSAGIDVERPSGNFDLVTLLIGVNNQYRSRSVEEYATQFRALVQQAIEFAAARPSRVVVVSIPDWGITPFARRSGRDVVRISAEIDAFNAAGLAEASRAGVHFVDITSVSRRAERDPTLVAGDGLHPSGAMYDEWAKLIFPVALQALGIGPEG